MIYPGKEIKRSISPLGKIIHEIDQSTLGGFAIKSNGQVTFGRFTCPLLTAENLNRLVEHFTQEQLCALVLRIVEKLVRSSFLNDLTSVHQDCPVGTGAGKTHLV